MGWPCRGLTVRIEAGIPRRMGLSSAKAEKLKVLKKA
jgi:hypothetical protein